MIRLALIAAAGLTLAAVPAAAQTYDPGYRGGDSYRSYDSYGERSYDSGYGDRSYGGGYGYRRYSNAAPSSFDWRSQLDRPGDYRCDQFWDASRSDCGARWRDQRRRASPQARRDYRALAGYGRSGYGYGHGRYGRGYGGGYGGGYGRGYGGGYGGGYGSAYGQAQGSSTYYGAYGRPDQIYPGGYGSGYGGGYGGGYGNRSDWCRANYRSYDPHTGYYRAYSGRLVYCG